MQRRAAIWILDTFKMSSLEDIEAIGSLIPIKLHLQKLMERSQLCILALPSNHIIYLLMNSSFESSKHHHSVSFKSLTSHQKANIKGHLVDSNDKAYGIFPSFFPLYLELSLGSGIIDNFSDWFSFNLSIRNKNKKICCQQLDNMVLEVSSSSSTTIVVSDASIKNNIATFISHVHIANQLLIKTLHHTVFVMSTEVELFAIRYQDCWWWTLFLFSLFTLFYFSFSFSFIFLFLDQLGLGCISHTVTSSHKLMA